jgi:hypothetical protein
MHIGAADVYRWHTEERGFSDNGYHDVIRRDGVREPGRPIEIMGAHAQGHNQGSIGIALVGGKSLKGDPESNFTFAQYRALAEVIKSYMAAFDIPKSKVIGHNMVSVKSCPCFDVASFVEEL